MAEPSSRGAPLTAPRAFTPGLTAHSGSERATVLGLVLLWAAMWLLVNPAGNFPINDDWAYAYAVRSILQSGQFTLTGFSAPNLIVQAYWGALFCLPFGFSYEALRLSTFVLALIGLAASYGLFRELEASPRTAAVGTLTLGANPLFLQLSASFMTDVPFTALVSVALWLFVRGMRREQRAAVLGAYGAAFLALFIRQFGMALPVGFGAAILVRRGVRPLALAAALFPVAVFAAAHSGFQHWVIATGRTPKFAEGLGELGQVSLAARLPFLRVYSLSMVPYFGLFVLPFLAYVAYCRPGARNARAFWLGGLALGLALFAVLAARHDLLLAFGNGLQAFGVGPLTLFDSWIKRRNVPSLPGATIFWTLLSLFSSWAVAVIVLCAARFAAGLVRDRAGARVSPTAWPQALMLAYVAAYVGAILLASLLDQVFDRYLVGVVVPLCAFLFLALRPRTEPSGPRGLAAIGALAGCALFSVLSVHDYMAFQRARWVATGTLEDRGIRPEAIDGGFEYSGAKLFDPHYVRDESKSWWWVRDNQYVVSLGPMPGYEIVGEVPFTHWIWFADYKIRILRRVERPAS